MNELGNTPADKNYKPSGISKAEELAMQAYPNMAFPFTPLDLNAYRREAFINGYEATEKDLALTWEDVKEIVNLADAIIKPTSREFPAYWANEEDYYTEVLTRYKQYKEEKK